MKIFPVVHEAINCKYDKLCKAEKKFVILKSAA